MPAPREASAGSDPCAARRDLQGREVPPAGSHDGDGWGPGLVGRAAGVQVGSGNLQVNNFYSYPTQDGGGGTPLVPASGPAAYWHGGHAFISYVREDSDEVDALQRMLEAAGVPVWRDTASLWPGEDWASKIRRAITGDALVFIACFSSRSAARRKTYMNEELQLAVRELRQRQLDDPWLIPVRFDNCRIQDLELGSGRTLASIQRTDLFGPGRDQAAARLVAAIQRLLRQPQGAAPALPADLSTKEPDPAGEDLRNTDPSRLDRSDLPGASSPGTAFEVPGVWGDVPARDKNFTGRDDLLQQLRARQGTLLTLRGTGGVGKTALAVEYAYRYRADYDLVWWIPAGQLPSVRRSLATLAAALRLVPPDLVLPGTAGMDAVISLMLAALRRGEPCRRWLLIFDNADHPEDISPLIPRGPGDVLITSRDHRWQSVTGIVAVDVFTRPEGRMFLRRRVPGSLTETDAGRLSGKLGDLPLALVSAGAMLSETGTPVDEYLRLLDERAAALTAGRKRSEYPLSIMAAWKLSVAALEERLPQALELLRCCAFFGPEPIPRNMFRQGAQLAGTPAAQVISNPILMAGAMRELGRYALVTLDGNSVSVHPLVQALLRESLTEQQRAAYRHEALLILAAAAPAEPDDARFWPQLAQLLPHVNAESAQVPRSREPAVRDLARIMMRYLYRAGDFESGLELTERCIGQWTTDSGPDSPEVLRAQRHLGNILRLTGRYQEASKITQQALATARVVMGESDPLTLALRSAYAADLRGRGSFAEAQALDAESRVVFENAFGADDARSLRELSYLALDHALNSDYQTARNLYERAHRRMSLASSEATPSDLTGAWLGLSWTLRLLGLYREALDVSLDAWDYAQAPDGLGPEHLATLRSVNAYTIVCRRLPERRAEALEVARTTLELSSRRFGDRHPDTLAIAVSLGNLLRTSSKGYHREALALAESTIARYPAVYGAGHPYYYGCLSNLALMKRVTGDPEAACTLDGQALRGLTAALGPDHHFSLTVAVNLASDFAALGRAPDARRLGEDTLRRLTTLLGHSHPDALACAANLALDLAAAGIEDAGKPLHDKTLRLFGEKYRHDFPDAAAVASGDRIDLDFDPPPI